jgi:hypothetical protein
MGHFSEAIMTINPTLQLQTAPRNCRFHGLLALCISAVAFEPSAWAATKFSRSELIVSKKAIYPDDIWELRTAAASDGVTIEGLIVNRGNCKPWRLPNLAPELPQTLKPGENRLYSYYLCKPIEVEVVTDRGASTYTLEGEFVQGPPVVTKASTHASEDEFVQGPLAVTKNDSTEPGHIWELRITTRADYETIESVTANQGDCKAHTPPRLPQILTFGETIGNFIYFCNPTVVQVTTNHGVSTFNWSE